MTDVLIIMGSASDKTKMLPARIVLKELGIDCEIRISSAHRTPKKTKELVHEAEKNGCKVIICGAGMAAHLAGAVAAETVLPVIGVPLSGSPVSGIDALWSTVQMPPGMPVATVAIDGAKNAAWLAAQIMALSDCKLRARLLEARTEAEKAVNEADKNLQVELTE